MKRLFLVPALLLLAASPLYARTWHIQADGTGDAPTIQAGIDSAATGDTVLVGYGRYLEHDIVLKSGIALLSETGEPSCAVIDADRSGGVLVCISVDNTTRISGFTITGGYAAGSGDAQCGGGAYLSRSSPRISDCLFLDNEARWLGGGLFCHDGSGPAITGCGFVKNRAVHGGGIGSDNAHPFMVGCTFSLNEASGWGGGMCMGFSQGSLRGCTITDNTADRGGGAYCSSSRTGFVDCEIAGNRVADSGGGIHYVLCGVCLLTGCRIEGNQARVGGGLFCGRSSPIIEDCVVTLNEVSEDGGGVYLQENSSPAMTRCLLFKNRAARAGGMLCNYRASPVLTNCVISENESSTGSGSVFVYYISTPEMRNTIFFRNGSGPALECEDASGADLSCCDVFGNAGGDYVGCIDGQSGADGNFSADPLFCGASGGDFTLRSNSPCLPGQHPDGCDCGLIGTFGQGCSGPTAVEHTSWGGVKRMFR